MHVSSDENMKNIIFSRGKKVEGENFQYLEKSVVGGKVRFCLVESTTVLPSEKSHFMILPTFQEKSDILPDFSMENSILFYIFRENS